MLVDGGYRGIPELVTPALAWTPQTLCAVVFLQNVRIGLRDNYSFLKAFGV